MWANVQRDGRPAKYRWRPLFNAAKFGWHTLLQCRAVMLPRRKTRWNFQGCPKLTNRSQPLVGRSSLYYDDVWWRYRCLTSFFLIVDTCHICEDNRPTKFAMMPKWQFFCILYFQWAACSTIQTCILNLHEGHTMCGGMVDIQSRTAEIRRGKKIETTEQKYNGLPYYIGRP